MATTYILGISAFNHDSAACLRGTADHAAVSEERFTRKKGDASFPRSAIAFCLRSAGIGVDELAYVGFSTSPP